MPNCVATDTKAISKTEKMIDKKQHIQLLRPETDHKFKHLTKKQLQYVHYHSTITGCLKKIYNFLKNFV